MNVQNWVCLIDYKMDVISKVMKLNIKLLEVITKRKARMKTRGPRTESWSTSEVTAEGL